MNTLRRKKIKKHINSITYALLFSLSVVVVIVATVFAEDKTEYKVEAEVETYIVDIVTIEKATLAAAPESDVPSEKETEDEPETTTATPETTEDLSKYNGIFIMNTSGNLNIRSEADASSEVVGILTEGNGGEVVSYGKEWTKVKSGDVKGYVATGYILIGDKAEKALEENGYTATINADTVKVRAERNTDCTVLGMAANGDSYQCTKVYDKWVKIKFEGQTGFVSKEFVKLEKVMTYAKTVAEIEAEQMAEIAAQQEAAQQQQTEAQQSEPSQSQSASQPVSDTSAGNSNTASSTPTTVQRPATNASYDDQYLLACIVACEAGGESYESKLAVANVVLNRVKSSAYPSTISGVVYQSCQFTPASNGSLERMLKNGPDAGSKSAASAALGGTNNVPGYLFFGRTSSINIGNLKKYTIIDHQVFY